MNGIFNTLIALILYIGTGVIVITAICYIQCQDTRSRVGTQDETNTDETANNEELIYNDV